MAWIAYLIAGAIVLCAALIVYRRVRDFIATKGMSGCQNCPYSGQCGGKCQQTKKK